MLWLLLWLGIGAKVTAQDPGANPETDAGVAVKEAAVADPRTAQVRALLDGTLDLSVTPQALFEVPLDDEAALQIEAVRIRTLLRAVDESAQKPEPPPPARPGAKATKVESARPIENATRADIEALDPAVWRARVDLDRARLAFYELSPEQRAEQLRAHAARQVASRPHETESERRARAAEAERMRALETARLARSEAERLVSEEMARLISVESAVAIMRERFQDEGKALVSRNDDVLGWQRRVRDAKLAGSLDADATYDALRRRLRAARDDLDLALDALLSAESHVPQLGPSPLSDIPSDIPTEVARKRRAVVDDKIRKARLEEVQLRKQHAASLLQETNKLNRERLSLLPYLSQEKRAATVGFTSPGLDQANSEARQLFLILRYHRYIATEWVTSMRGQDGSIMGSLWHIAPVAVTWTILLFAFVTWRRRSPALLVYANERLAEADRNERRSTASAARRVVHFLSGIHRPVEWLVLFGAAVWLLPLAARGLLEVQLLIVIIGWTLSAALVVNVVHTIAMGSSGMSTTDARGTGLRLRSLRLVGSVTVVLVLVLLLSARLVGEGTIYNWVHSTCWFAAVPVFLMLVRWWRETVFERVERVRKKSELQTWILTNRSGWKSFFAAMIAAVQLFALGSVKTVVGWLAGFDLVRRAHAYLFKRELDRLVGRKPATESLALHATAFAQLAPDAVDETWIACPADESLAQAREYLSRGQGGLIAIVGGRGLGKSTLLQRLNSHAEGVLTLQCSAQLSVQGIRSALDGAPQAPGLFVLDDAHALIKPMLGGLRTFDEVSEFARAHCTHTLWVFAIDTVVWPFLKRARDEKPLFDLVIELEPWGEDEIGKLLTERTFAAGVTPSFEDLLETLPPSADEIDIQEALSAKRIGYFRMIWDYARGNPGIALEVWRSSLVEDAEGTVRVRPLKAPDSAELDALPDSALFILRAVLQLAPASVEDVAQATRLTEGQVHNAFLFGQAHGYLIDCEGKVCISWAWLRSVLRLLERRHLLVNP